MSFKAKKVRGLMADAIVELMLENPEELKEIQIEGYSIVKILQMIQTTTI